MNAFPCLKECCLSPTARSGFDHCREKHFVDERLSALARTAEMMKGRLQMRIDHAVRRDGSHEAAVRGKGCLVGLSLADDIAKLLGQFSEYQRRVP